MSHPHGTAEVNIGYYPFKVTAEEFSLHVGPAADTPRVNIRENIGSRRRHWLHIPRPAFVGDYGADFGWQSTRNPGYDPTPPMRAAVNGFAWGFVRGGFSGWIPIANLKKFSPPKGYPLFDGPAGDDFEVGRQPAHHGYDSGVGSLCEMERRVVKARTMYLRYAPESTSIYVLGKGDVVSLRRRGPHSTFAVEVVRAKWVPAGTVGWVPQEGLRRQAR